MDQPLLNNYSNGPNYPPQNYGGYPPQPAGHPPQENYPPQGGHYPPQGNYPPQGGHYPPQGQHYPPQGYPPQGGYVPPQSHAPVPQAMGAADLNSLSRVPSMWVRQKVDWLEVAGSLVGGAGNNIDVSNTYEIFYTKSDMEQKRKWMFAKEESDMCARMCCSHHRNFKMKVGTAVPGKADTLEEKLGLISSDDVIPVIDLERPCYCLLSEMHIRDINNRQIGTLNEGCTNLLGVCPLKATFSVNGREEYEMSGSCPCWISLCKECPCRDPFDFNIKTVDGKNLGSIHNVPNGACKMCFTSADDYEVRFDPMATADQRGLILAAVFALDSAYFETKNQRKD